MNQELFDLYTDYLISSFGPTTATGLARLLDGQVSHDQVTRLLATEPQKSADLWRVVKLERLKLKTKLSHFTLKTKLYQAALQTAYAELVKLKEQLATA